MMSIKNKMGFTLIELIATITILGIIMLVAVPNVIGVVNKNKSQTYVNDARKLVTLAKYKFDSDANVMRPSSTNCVVMKISGLDRSELQKGPEEGTYDENLSFVVIKYENSKYEYYAQLVENYNKNGTQYKGIALMKYSDLVKIEAKNTSIKSGQEGFKNVTSLGGIGCSSTTVYPDDEI